MTAAATGLHLRLSRSRPTFSTPADNAACREMIRGGSKSFYAASLLLPDGVRGAAYALYGFCRLSDDAVDVEGGQSDAVARLRARLDRVYAGDPAPHAVDRTLADTVLTFGIPRTLLEALLEGLEWDVAGRSYEEIGDVYAYGARVAGSVGAMMAVLMGSRSRDQVARACDLGVAMQLTNIARDVGEDARAGRLYLPRAWLREAGVDPDAWLANPAWRPEIGAVVARLLACADTLYRRADAGVANLDPAFRPAIYAARHLYAEIGYQLARAGLDSVSRRTCVPAARKGALMLRAVTDAVGARRIRVSAAPLDETRFLVDAVTWETGWGAAARPARQPTVAEDAIWMVDLFANLERRTRPHRLHRG